MIEQRWDKFWKIVACVALWAAGAAMFQLMAFGVWKLVEWNTCY